MKLKNKAFKRLPFSQLGFTYIEAILYIAIVTIMLNALVPFAWNIINSSAKSSTEQEVYSAARFISEKIKYEIRNSNGINTAGSTFDTSPGTLSLSNTDSTKNPTIITITNGKVTLKYGASAAVDLNSADTTVTSLIFTNYTSSDNKTKNVQFSLTAIDNLNTSRQEYNETISLESDAEIRSN